MFEAKRSLMLGGNGRFSGRKNRDLAAAAFPQTYHLQYSKIRPTSVLESPAFEETIITKKVTKISFKLLFLII